MKTPTLETERLILRKISLDDAPALQAHFDNWNIIKYLSTMAQWPYPEGAMLEFIRDALLPGDARGEALHWGITLKDTGEPIGKIGYRALKTDVIDRGFWLAEPYHGQGLMTEAVSATQDYMFFEYGAERVIVRNVVSNKASHRIKEKTGAVYLETIPDAGDHHLKEDVEVWEVTKAQWTKIRGRD